MPRRKRPTARRLGFRPPNFALDAELEWILQRAFGPPTWTPTALVAAPKVVDQAVRLDLAARIAARQPRQLLVRELGDAGSELLREHYVSTVARDALLRSSLDMLLRHAEVLGVPCILLKYAALSRMGVLRPGARSASDIDVLVPESQARGFQAALERNGYEDVGLAESAHQLPGLLDPNGILIEVHVHVPAITLAPGEPFARANDLMAAGLTSPSGNALLPDPAIVVAHALAHGLVQHARAPHIYSPLKAFADLADLQLGRDGALDRAEAFLSAALTPDDVTSALTLASALPQGNLEAAMSGGSGVMLRHALASQLDRRYAFRLRLRVLTQPGPTSVHLSPARFLAGLGAAWGWARSWAVRDKEQT
jgi:putative nucleotidyltransferase-like protein